VPAVCKDITIQAGSYEPRYWEIRDGITNELLDLTGGYTVSGVVSSRDDGRGTDYLTLTDADFRRTDNGRIYYEPSSDTTASWTFRYAHYQFELRHPSGQDVRFAEGRFIVDPET
jgi:hypothetical protein